MTTPPVAILCGGLATRLRPITVSSPKALVEVNNRPFIFYQLDQLKEQQVTDVILCVGYKADMIQEAVGDGQRFGLRVRYSYDGDEFLGTGGAIRKALPLLSEEFFVLYGDAYLRVDYQEVYRSFSQSGKLGLMTVFENKEKWDSSNVWFENRQILAYSKTDKVHQMHHIDYGLGLLHTAAFKSYAEGQKFDLAEVYEQLVQDRELAALEVGERFYEIGSHSGLDDFAKWLDDQRGSVS